MEATSTDRRPWPRWHGRLMAMGLGLVAANLFAPVHADLTDVPNLTPPEQQAARATQAIYDALRDQGEQNALPDDQQAMFDKLEELVHTANEQQGLQEPTNRSLQVDEDGLAFALDWVASEEASSGSSVAVNAVHTQFAQAVRRIAALQAGGFGVARATEDPSGNGDVLAVVRRDAPYGGGASADLVTRWGGFVNVSYGVFDHDRTVRENESDVDHYSATLGMDYRVTDANVVGASLTYGRADLEFGDKGGFDGGDMETDGYNLSVYGLHDRGAFYLNGVVTVGRMELDLTRNITYQSNNPSVPDTDETALSSTDGQQFLASLGAGYQFDLRPVTITPSARFDVLRISIDSYTERDGGAFNLDVDSQTIESARSTIGVDVTRPVATGFGVLVPRLALEWHHEFDDPNPDIESRFVADPTSTTFFSPGDDPDRDYFTLSGSATAVLPRGLQAFAEAQARLGLRDTTAYNITAGVRGEF